MNQQNIEQTVNIKENSIIIVSRTRSKISNKESQFFGFR